MNAPAHIADVSFRITDDDGHYIAAIVERALAMAKKLRRKGVDRMSLRMDITAAHANGCALDLRKLLEASDFTFAHDVFGIEDHLDRSTGELLDFFTPRCARSMAA